MCIFKLAMTQHHTLTVLYINLMKVLIISILLFDYIAVFNICKELYITLLL